MRISSNFYFLENEWPEFFQRAAKAEKLLITDPRTSLTYARMALELAVNWMYNNDQELEKPYSTNLSAFMMDYQFKNQFTNKLYRDIDLIRHIGNLAIHNKPVTAVDSEKVITNLFYFAKWFAKSYTTEEIEEIGLFDYTIIPKEGEAALSKKQLSDLQAKLDKDLDSYKDQLNESLERNKELEEKNELFRQQIEQLQAQIEANKKTASHEDEIHHPRNEEETRKYLIDVALREAGWDLSGANDKEYEVSGMPLSTNPTGVGYVDYVLWDDNGKPLALVEAKKTMESAKKGENQAQLYADCLEYMHGQQIGRAHV
jgi:type I restriction enzyme, R subunit